ncbi:glycosyl transferase family 90 [Budvicia diplopodorum]|uniref:glycosyl transferase family 90 n=1 Tax=Budvicia diplopodorum TaxID=1119056 RepID=UPI001BAAED96|nr:glycosyl transferase family 90 [Budvicia diplopodorum]
MHIRKVPFYARNIIKDIIPRSFFRLNIEKLISGMSDIKLEKIYQRVNYYNKLSDNFSLDSTAMVGNKLSVRGNASSYYYDFMEAARYFDGSLKFNYFFRDIKHIPDRPTFVKTRPISGENQNSVLLKLNKIRHFGLFDDKIPFENKLDMAVFRGACYQDSRKLLLETYKNSPLVNIGDTGRHNGKRLNLMSEVEQMKYKFIISIEGNDVATNLKWIMHSNSLCFMRKPRIESWFMEANLIPDYHYVLLNDDFSDLEEKIAYYSQHIDEAKFIINNAHEYLCPFLDQRQEHLISILVMKKYFELSGQQVELA